MPYNNPLNRKISSEVRNILQKYIDHTPMSYDVAEGMVGYANKKLLDDTNLKQEEVKLDQMDEKLPEDNELQGGAYGAVGGFARGTVRDTGEGRTLGAGYKVNKKKLNKEKELLLKRELEGGKPIKPFVKALKRRSKIANPLDVIGVVANIASKVPIPVIAEVGDFIKKGTDGLNIVMGREDQAEGVNKTIDNVASSIGLGRRKGRPSKMKGGAEDLAEPHNMVRANGTTGDGKPKRQIGGRKLVPVANMQSSSMAGQGKKKKGNDGKKKRADIVKDVMKKRGCSMIEASKIVKAENLY